MDNTEEEKKRQENPLMVIDKKLSEPIAKTNERSLEIGQLVAALAKAQGQMENAKKDSENPFFKRNYADLSSVINVAKKPLSDNDLAITQLISPSKEFVIVTTMLMHKSGEYLTSTISLTPVKSDPQGFGSAITYARRYAYQSIIGLSAEDDDGNAASDKKEAPKPIPAKPVSAAQVSMLKGLLDQKGKSVESVLTHFKIGKLEELNSFQCSEMINKLLNLSAPKKPESGAKTEEVPTDEEKREELPQEEELDMDEIDKAID